MKNVGDRALTVGVLLIGMIVAAIVWFVAIGPKLSSAQDARDAALEQESHNTQLRATLQQRQKDEANLPNVERELYWIRDIIPTEDDIPSLRRMISGIVSAQGLEVQDESVTQSSPIIGGLSLAAPMAQVGLVSEIEGEGFIFSTLEANSVTIRLDGPPTKILAIVDELQFGEHRYLLIESLSITWDRSGPQTEIRAIITASFFTLDRGVDGVTVRPEERPWPGTEEAADCCEIDLF